MFRHLRIQSPERSSRALPAALLALAASGCGRQFDLGEIAQLLEQNGGESAAAQPLGGTVLLSSVDDIDVVVSDATVSPPEPTPDSLPTALGDVDGDGFGDWIQGDTLFYGAPRPEGERLEIRDRTRFRFELAGNGSAAASAREALASVGLDRRLSHYPKQLSGGEKQRVAIERAFVTRPEVLFADEPTGNLDTASGARVADLLFGLNRQAQTTLVLVTHERALASRCDRTIEIDGGRLVA